MLTIDGEAGGDRPSRIQLSLAGRTTFGRAKRPPLPTDHHIILDKNGNDLSRFHASITCQQLPDGAHRWLLKDNNSLNGLLVNLRRVERAKNCDTVLKNGDYIAFGGSHSCAVGTKHPKPETLKLVYQFSDGFDDGVVVVPPPPATRQSSTDMQWAPAGKRQRTGATANIQLQASTHEDLMRMDSAAATQVEMTSAEQSAAPAATEDVADVPSKVSFEAGDEASLKTDVGGVLNITVPGAQDVTAAKAMAVREAALIKWEMERAIVEQDLARREAELKATESDRTKAGAAAMAGEMAETELRCSICFDVIVCTHLLQCGHHFCYECITTWLVKPSSTQNCPECRHDVSAEPVPAVGMDQAIERCMQLRPDHEQQEWEQRLAEAKKLKAKDKAAAAAKRGLFQNSSAAAAGRYGRGWNPLGPHDEFTSAVLGRNLDALRARAESQQAAARALLNQMRQQMSQAYDDDAQEHYCIEYARSGRSSCRVCSNLISVASLRVGVEDDGSEIGRPIMRWHHLQCILPQMVEQEIRGANLSGLRTLSPTDQTLIREQLAPRVAVGLQPVVQPSGSMRLILAGVAPEAPETISLVSDDDEDDPYEESSGSDEEPIVADDDEEEEDSMGSEELLVDENGDVID